MRFLTVTLLSTGFAFSALAQQQVTPTAPVALNPITISPNNVPVTGSVMQQPVNRAGPTGAIVRTKPLDTTPEKPALDDIGYDPKVKRDPMGNIIGAAKEKPNATTKEGTLLRNDSGAGLRSDSHRPTVTTPATPTVTPVTPTNTTGARTQGVTNGMTTTTVSSPVVPTAIRR